MRHLYFGFLLISIFFCACDSDIKQKKVFDNPLFTVLDSNATNINFINQITETEEFNFLLYEYLQNGGGVAIGDINNDGLDDIYFSGNTVFNRLYLNLGDFKFKDITESAGVNGGMGFKTGVTMSDVNGDGLLDIYVCKSAISDPAFRKNILYINNGDLTFSDKSSEFGLDDPSYSTQAYFFDMDNDGDQDMYLVNHPFNLRESNNINVVQDQNGQLVVKKPATYTYISDRLYLNENNKFKDVSSTAGILNEAFGLSAVIGDFNLDGLQDIYVCNDYVMPDILYINQGKGKFTDKFDDYFAHSSFSSMGSDFADINNDGCFDLMTLDMLPRDHYRQNMLGMAQNYDKFNKLVDLDLKAQFSMNALQLNNCNGKFSDISFLAGVAMSDWSWSVLMADFDNDSKKDIFISNGYVRDVTNNDYTRYTMDSLQKELNLGRLTLLQWLKSIPSNKIPSYLFKNNGDLTFTDKSDEWNVGGDAYSSGAAYADLDNDGFLDLVVSNIDQPPFIMRNNGNKVSKNNFLTIDLHKENKLNLTGVKAIAYLSDGSMLHESYAPTRGFLSSSQHRLHFGIAEGLSIQKLEIHWNLKEVQTILKPELNKQLVIKKENISVRSKQDPEAPIFKDITSKMITISHEENSYNDLKREPLLHRKYSHEGPAAAVADVNNDGLDDLYIGGAFGFPGKIYLQQRSGEFKEHLIPDFVKDKDFEDVGAVFADFNGDGFLDLYVASGGNEHLINDPLYSDRLYINNGKSDFIRKTDVLPPLYNSAGTVVASDIDRDGDIDLFIGNRLTPGRYPELPPITFLKNDNGKFSDATSLWAPSDLKYGMVTSAVFADIDNDSKEELIITGEWMSINVLKWNGKQYQNISKDLGLDQYFGWWSSLTVSDLDNDGFPEIIAGNLGLNAQITASKEKPVDLWFSDFDNNGTIDPVLCYFHGDKSYPLHFRDKLLDQMVFLKKKFKRYHQYANASIEDIFDKSQLKSATKLSSNTFAHHLFLNEKGKSFKPIVLPTQSQFSVINSIFAKDIDGNGIKDLITVGNYYNTDVQSGRYDASIGALTLVDKMFKMNNVSSTISGINADGDVRRILSFNGESKFWIVRNDGQSSFYLLDNQ
jgi:enediyne biosynthesis protein E4